jgi:hypothetical protein
LDIRFSLKESVIGLGALALGCLAPLLASAKAPVGLPYYGTDQDSNQTTPFTRTSVQSPAAGEQQPANSQAEPRLLPTERMVSKPPHITYVDGQLTIVAESSRLSEVMSALRAAMGTDVELPPSIADQRIWARLGPGPARKVLRDLLDNTELNYVIQASDSDEQGVRSVSLTLRSKTGEQSVPGSRMARGSSRRSLPESSNPVEAPDQDSSTPAAESAAVSDAAPAGPPPPSTGAQFAANKVPSSPGASDASLSRPGAGVSGQMIQQLQSMYQQRRQIQIQQNQKPPSNNN